MWKKKLQGKLENSLNRMKMKITTYQNAGAAAEAMLSGKCIALNTCKRKNVRSLINFKFPT